MIATAMLWYAVARASDNVTDNGSLNIPALAMLMTILVDIVGYAAVVLVVLNL